MQAAKMSEIINALVGDPISFFFTTITFGLFGISLLILLAVRRARNTQFIRATPSVLTSLGVLGTFAGIFLGLIDFDVSNIDKSVPQLLAGLKLAFITSIVGMSTAIVHKTFQTLLPGPRDDAAGDVTANEIYGVLREIRDDAKSANGTLQSSIDRLRTSISGDADSSLVSQFQKLRSENSDKFNELKSATEGGFTKQIDEFRLFAAKMAENNSKALIEALEAVIKDFNAKINEQFGENFKHLNEAVGRLLVWQENYKLHVEKLVQQFDTIAQGIETAKRAIQEIASKAESIPATMQRLAEIIESLNKQSKDVGEHLSAFAELKEKAINAFPIIEKNMQNLTTDISNTIGSLKQTLDSQKQSYSEIEKGFEALQRETAGAIDGLAAGIEKTISAAGDKFTRISEEHSKIMQSSFNTIQRGFEQAIQKSAESLGNQVTELDRQMQAEVSRVIELMGGKLASLSNKFVEDYGPLTDKLRRLVEVGRQAP